MKRQGTGNREQGTNDREQGTEPVVRLLRKGLLPIREDTD